MFYSLSKPPSLWVFSFHQKPRPIVEKKSLSLSFVHSFSFYDYDDDDSLTQKKSTAARNQSPSWRLARRWTFVCVSFQTASLSESVLSCRLFLNCCWCCCGPFPLLLISLQTRFVSFFCAPFIIVFQHLWTRRVRYPEGFFSLLLLHDAAGFYFLYF